MLEALRKTPLRLQASLYARSLHERLSHYPHVPDLSFRLCGKFPLPNGIHQLSFSGATQFITPAQIREILNSGRSTDENVILVEKEDFLEIKIELPKHIPAEIGDIRRLYRQKMEQILEAERCKPIENQCEAQAIAPALRALHLEVMPRIVKIAQNKAKKKFGQAETQLAVFLVAGSAGKSTLLYDLDFIVVFQGKNRAYFNYLAGEIEKTLAECGIKSDNLISTLSKGRAKTVQINNRQNFIRIDKFAADALPIETVSDQTTVKSFFDHVSSYYQNEEKLLAPYYFPNIWLKSLYLIDRRDIDSRGLLSHSLETRKIKIAQAILRTEAGLCAARLPYSTDMLQALETRGFINSTELQQVAEAESFFNRLKNALGYIHQGKTTYFTAAEIPALKSFFDCRSNSLGLESFKAEIKRHSNTATNFLKLAESRNFKKRTRQIYNLFARIKDFIEMLWQRTRNLGFDVAIYCN